MSHDVTVCSLTSSSQRGSGAIKTPNNSMTKDNIDISMCALNVCGFIGKMKYGILQEYISQFDFICLSETKCDSISENEINGYKSFIMQKKSKSHRYGGIHGLCIFIKQNIATFCKILNDFTSESILWIYVKKHVLGYDFILGAVYLPHEMSDHYHENIFEYLADDVISINAMYDVPIILLGDFNSRVSTLTDFEHEFEHLGSIIETDPYTVYFENHNITDRINKDQHVNNNGKKLIELCKMSNLKIINGRIGKDKLMGSYTCHTNNGKSTIDYAIASMKMFPNIVDFYVDILDTCMSDVHCPIGIVLSGDNMDIQDTHENTENKKYIIENNIVTKWDHDHCELYTKSFNMEDITEFHAQLRICCVNVPEVSQLIIDNLYTCMKDLFLKPAKSSGMHTNRKYKNKALLKRKRHKQHNWFNNDCKTLRKEYMCLKNSLKGDHVSITQHQLYHAHAKKYKKLILKTKRAHTKQFHNEIRQLKTHNPKEFWKILKSESEHNTDKPQNIIFSDFIEHFRKLNSGPQYIAVDPIHLDTSDKDTTDDINMPFTLHEVQSAIKQLKNNKASGVDHMIYEFFKFCPKVCLEIIVDLFNLILDTGYVPTEWGLGMIYPLYKNKGSVKDPDNYRGITLLSCTGKLFTACLNKRISYYVDDAILGEEQAGFREGYSTIDHIFVLHIIIQIYQSVNKRVYCAFIDYQKAFDSINRTLLWEKLLSYKINGKVYNVIKNMYINVKSCIKKENMMSEYFMCNVGVRQGDNLSPLLFALFINDFKDYISMAYNGLNIADSCYPILNDENIVLLKLFVLLYADDTIILAENQHELQRALTSVHKYCVNYNLTVNIKKTKIIIFSRGKVRKYPSFTYGKETIEVVSDYVYLGVTMNYNNKLAKAIRKQLDQARRAQFAMLIKARKLDLPIDIQCNLFDKLVTPVLLYGCEVWGVYSNDMSETFHRKFFKKILKLRPSTPTCMVYGEVGKYPLQVTINKYIVSYWLRILNKEHSTLAHIVYIIALKLYTTGSFKAQWICKIKSILDNCGLSYIWDNQEEIDTRQCKILIYKQIEDQAIHQWYIDINASSMCSMYRIFKKQFHFEKYLLLSNSYERTLISKYRCSNSKLPVYNQIYMYDTDLCTLCHMGVRGDEYHYILLCPFFKQSRKQFLKPYYYIRPCIFKFEQLFSSTNRTTQCRLAKLIRLIIEQF